MSQLCLHVACSPFLFNSMREPGLTSANTAHKKFKIISK